MLVLAENSIWYDIGVGALGNLAFVLGVAVIAYVLFSVSHRRALIEFFGVQEEGSISIYTAHLLVIPGGATDVLGTPRSFRGSATVYGENAAASRLASRFTGLFPGLSSQVAQLSSLTLQTITVESGPSPMNVADIKKGQSFVSIGSPGYNIASSFIESVLHSPVQFVHGNTAFNIPSVGTIGTLNQGFIVRVPYGRHYAFYVAGLNEPGTCGAVQYLAENWLQLHRRYKRGVRFFVLIEVNYHWENPRLVAEGEI